MLLLASVSAEQGARYLVIVPDSMVAAVRPLVEWKSAKGMLAKAVPLSVTGSSPEAVQTYVRDAWNNWPVKPEYVLIVGGPAHVRFPGNAYDCRFGDVTGDYHVELGVGRFWVRTVRECSTIVNKTLAYERPSLADTAWFVSGTTVVREDNDPDDSIYWNDSRTCHDYWRQSGYCRIDSLSMNRGDSSRQVAAAANRGTAFITYRGQCGGSWWSPFNRLGPFAWTNGDRLPVVLGVTCASIMVETNWSWVSDSMIRAVSPSALGGAVAYFGTTSISNVPEVRSKCLRGFTRALYVEHAFRLSGLTRRGQRWVDSLYPGQQVRYEEWNLLGDPELGVWSGIPRELTMQHESLVNPEPQDFAVRVLQGGQPVRGAVVCVSMDSTVYASNETDSAGSAVLHIAPVHSGAMRVVVTGRNLVPSEGTCLVGPVGHEDAPVGSPQDERRVTVVRSRLVLPQTPVANRQSPSALFDATGRTVMALHAGPNDVRHLAPGVYFVRRWVSIGLSDEVMGPEASSVARVVIAR